ncbi:hypothetical protein VTG60DRAFT_1486 [Thermothelomyces hinnuleus]
MPVQRCREQMSCFFAITRLRGAEMQEVLKEGEDRKGRQTSPVLNRPTQNWAVVAASADCAGISVALGRGRVSYCEENRSANSGRGAPQFLLAAGRIRKRLGEIGCSVVTAAQSVAPACRYLSRRSGTLFLAVKERITSGTDSVQQMMLLSTEFQGTLLQQY